MRGEEGEEKKRREGGRGRGRDGGTRESDGWIDEGQKTGGAGWHFTSRVVCVRFLASSARVDIVLPVAGKPLISVGFSQSTHNFPFILHPPLIAVMVLHGFNGSTFATHSEPAVYVWKWTSCRRRGYNLRKWTCVFFVSCTNFTCALLQTMSARVLTCSAMLAAGMCAL